MGNPVLSIGIIFKNEIRCMERCLKSLQPLRDAIPCELVMADTGSDDGSREVAEQYADILFDFPWVNDFAAARNAVQDRCTGRWYFSVDCDEFLDPDVTQLVHFLQGQARPQDTAGVVLVRNYMTEGMNEDYTDFQAGRLLRLSTGARWTGAIHERWEPKGKKPLRWIRLFKTILYHDGYIGFNGARGETKRQRNVVLLREELEKAPDNLQRLNQFIESGDQQPDLEEKIRHAVDMVKQKGPGWEKLGASILRHGVVFAGRNGLVSSRQEWTRFAQDWFPDSYFTRIDITALSFLHAMQDGEDYAAAVQLGEKYLQAFDDLQTDAIKSDLTVGSLFYSLPSAHRQLKTLLVTAYQKEKQWEKGLQLISELVVSPLNTDEISRTLQGLLEIQEKTQLDTSATIISFWEQLDKSTAEQAGLRKHAFRVTAGNVFVPEYRTKAQEEQDFCREAYTLFLPLEDICETGRAAAVLAEHDPASLSEKLSCVEHWEEFPIHALTHALRMHVAFPLPRKAMYMEEMDGLAGRLARDKDSIFELACQAADKGLHGDWQDLLWIRSLVIAAIRAFAWAEQDKKEEGMTLTRIFVKTEKIFLPFCYSVSVLQEETLCALPPVHRFGWYCAQAFDALDAGDTTGYVRLLRKGLDTCKAMKPMVEFLTEHTPELNTPESDPELLDLAGKVHDLLALYPQDDPAVVAIKASDVYKRVAHLIEEP